MISINNFDRDFLLGWLVDTYNFTMINPSLGSLDGDWLVTFDGIQHFISFKMFSKGPELMTPLDSTSDVCESEYSDYYTFELEII